MIKIAVCDDEKFITEKIETLLADNLHRKKIVNYTLDVFNTSSMLRDYINAGNDYDLLYLDVEMPDIDGLELAKEIRNDDRDALIVYISGHENYMIDMFPVFPFRFMRKPIEPTLFARNFDEAYEELNRRDYYFQYDFKGVHYRIPIRDISHFESSGHDVYIKTRKGDRVEHFRGKMNELEKQLKEQKGQFLRIHQSYLVNCELIMEMNFDYVKMHSGECLSISQDRRKGIRSLYMK